MAAFRDVPQQQHWAPTFTLVAFSDAQQNYRAALHALGDNPDYFVCHASREPCLWPAHRVFSHDRLVQIVETRLHRAEFLGLFAEPLQHWVVCTDFDNFSNPEHWCNYLSACSRHANVRIVWVTTEASRAVRLLGNRFDFLWVDAKFASVAHEWVRDIPTEAHEDRQSLWVDCVWERYTWLQVEDNKLKVPTQALRRRLQAKVGLWRRIHKYLDDDVGFLVCQYTVL